MTQELYADGIGEITVTGTIVRIDLMSLSATERDANNNPRPAFRQRIIMPVDAFANAVDLMQKALNGLPSRLARLTAGAAAHVAPLSAAIRVTSAESIGACTQRTCGARLTKRR